MVMTCLNSRSYRRLMSGSSLLLAGLSLVSSASAEIKYRVDVLPEAGTLHVVMKLDHTSNGAKLQMPNWMPGAYFLNENFKNVKNLVAVDPEGKVIPIDVVVEEIQKKYKDGLINKTASIKVQTWNVAPAKNMTISYDIASRPIDGAVHWGGATTYLYEVNRRLEKCELDVHTPQGWPVYVGLNETRTGSNIYTAKTYDVLADNPVSTGELTVDSYVSRGKTHWIVLRGAAKSKVDRAALIQSCKFVSDGETDFFGGKAPYDKYVWHFSVMDSPDGAGGLEHLSSTQISLASGVGPRAKSVLAHEFFHLWNVKRIRSLPLGPFDYTKLPQTGALWWLEGVTDYFAFLLPHRYKGLDDASFFATIAANIQTVKNNPAHTQVGPNEASLRVDETNNGRGNSNGYLLSYYNLGWLAGMCLDIELRHHTQNKHSLDDVEHALWELCRNDKPGFKEDEIRNQVIHFGGEEMAPVYDRIVMKGDGMALEDTLHKVGLKLNIKPEPYTDLGFSAGGFPGATGLTVNSVRSNAEGKIQVTDTILSLNGTAIAGETTRAMQASFTKLSKDLPPGSAVRIKLKRGDVIKEVEVIPASLTRNIYSVERDSDATPEQKKLGSEWLRVTSIR